MEVQLPAGLVWGGPELNRGSFGGISSCSKFAGHWPSLMHKRPHASQQNKKLCATYQYLPRMCAHTLLSPQDKDMTSMHEL